MTLQDFIDKCHELGVEPKNMEMVVAEQNSILGYYSVAGRKYTVAMLPKDDWQYFAGNTSHTNIHPDWWSKHKLNHAENN